MKLNVNSVAFYYRKKGRGRMNQFDEDEKANQGEVRWELMCDRNPSGFTRNR
jgi:hypothetical protein